jgi:DNA-binding transcriptional MerR regulator
MPGVEGYRVPDVCRIVGISYRQLDYWARTGLVNPSIRQAGGSGTQRLYSFQDLVQLRVIKQLLDTGISLQKIRQAVGFLREHMNKQPVGTTLLSDGSRIYSLESPEEIIDLLQRGQGVFAIALDKVWDDLEGAVARRREPTPSKAGTARVREARRPAVARARGA